MKKLSATILSLTLLSSVLVGQRDLKAGFGAQSLVVDLDSATGQFGSLGIQHLNGEIFVTTRNDPAVGGLHFVTVFDGSGNKLRSWFQAGFAQASEWGFRDGATDGNNLFFGFDFGLEIIDANGVLQTGIGVPNVQTANGPRVVLGGLISGNVLEPEQAGLNRANAYDRSGNGGEGSFWTGNFGSSTFEIDIAGDIITTHANAGEVSYGFGLDPLITDGSLALWINSAPNSGTIAEYDTATGTLTGRVMDMGQNNSSVQGGLDVVPGTLGRGPSASGSDILHLQQGQPDEFRIRRLHLDQAGQGIPPSPFDRNGSREPDILASIDNEEVFARGDRASLNYTIASFELDLFFDIARNPGDGMGSGGGNGTSGVIFVNVGADAAPGVCATSNLLDIRELAHLQPLLTIPVASRAPRSRGVTATNDPMNLGPSEWRVALTPGMPFASIGDCIRAQALFIDQDVAFLPIALTNQLRLCRGPDPLVFIGTWAECVGGNTFNADTTSGFFSLINEETDPSRSIVAVTYSINPGDPGNSVLTQQLFDNRFRWDTDNLGMADLFEGGNSLLPGCLGTYRNGSEISTGLIFAGTPDAPCDPGAQRGWAGSDDGPTAFGTFDGDFLTLDFTFAPDTFMNGAVFEFDTDTDGGVGVSGGAMAGVIVTIQFRDGTITSGEMVADPSNSNRGAVQL